MLSRCHAVTIILKTTSTVVKYISLFILRCQAWQRDMKNGYCNWIGWQKNIECEPCFRSSMLASIHPSAIQCCVTLSRCHYHFEKYSMTLYYRNNFSRCCVKRDSVTMLHLAWQTIDEPIVCHAMHLRQLHHSGCLLLLSSDGCGV